MSTPTVLTDADTLCPRCQKPLADPRGLGWCQACGYCRSLEEDRARLPVEKTAPRPATPETAATVISRVPPWVVGMLIGGIVIVLASWVMGHFVTLRPLHRALWTTIQVVAGILVMLAGQSLALFKIAPEESSLNFIDAVMPFRLYGMLFKRLPHLWLPLCLVAWGKCLTLSALLLIGGLGHWLNYLPKSNSNNNAKPAYMPVR